jgi:hypothetical protein
MALNNELSEPDIEILYVGRSKTEVWIILKLILNRVGGMDWIDLAQDRDQWMALVNKVMNHRGSIKYLKILE